MNHLQEFLYNGGTTDQLKTEFGINIYKHPTLPLVGFKYNQIESPKTHPIVRDCRGIVLEDKTWNLVAKTFRRFYNAGEFLDEFNSFNWNDFYCNSKEDGSLILLFYYNDEWHVNTSGSFGLGQADFSGRSWRELFWDASGINIKDLCTDFTYIFELCTPFNKIVRLYPESTVYLLSAFKGHDEVSPQFADELAKEIGVNRPLRYHFTSYAEITNFLVSQEASDKTFEGVIIRDDKNLRFKCKSKTYVALHHLKNNGNIFNFKRLVPLVLAGEVDETVAYLPEIKDAIYKVKSEIDLQFDSISQLWEATQNIKDQKTFALTIKDHPFSSILFKVRKTNVSLNEEWRNSSELIVKKLYS